MTDRRSTPLSPEERLKLRPSAPREDFRVDDHLVADIDGVIFMDKPAAWPTSGRHLHDEVCLQHRLMTHYGRMVWAVHQLDGDTSGLNVFVRRKELVPKWQDMLHYPKARKEYLAIVHGRIEKSMKIDKPIGRRKDGSWGIADDGKSALTLVFPVAQVGDFTLVRVQLRTGRTHQIRVHMSDAGYPLVGEFWYNDAPCELAPRHMLHAWRTAFTRFPCATMVHTRLPEDFRACAQRLGIEIPDEIDGTSTVDAGFVPKNGEDAGAPSSN